MGPAVKLFLESQKQVLTKINDKHGNFYIFNVPPGTMPNCNAILQNGQLNSYKLKGEFYRTVTGLKDDKWLEYGSLIPISITIPYYEFAEIIKDKISNVQTIDNNIKSYLSRVTVAIIEAEQEKKLSPEYIHCYRKITYTREETAIGRAKTESDKRKERWNHYRCRVCGFFHVGHEPTEKGTEEIMAQSTSIKYGNKFLSKIFDSTFHNQYVFQVPEGTPPTSADIISNGTLVAYLKKGDRYREKDGVISERWRLFNTITPVNSKEDAAVFAEAIEKHIANMGIIGDETALTSLTAPPRIITASARQVPTPEKFGEYFVHRGAKNAPFLKRTVKCHACSSAIELIHKLSEVNGKITRMQAGKPVDPNARTVKPKSKDWLCGECAGKADQKVIRLPGKKPDPVPVPTSLPPAPLPPSPTTGLPPLINDILVDLEQKSLDQNISADTIRGMLYMVTRVLRNA